MVPCNRALLALAFLSLCACGPKSSGKAGEESPPESDNPCATPAAPEAAPEPVAEPTPEEKEAERKRLVDETLATLPEVQKQLGELRGTPFAEEIPAAYQSQEDFRAFVSEELSREFPDGKGEKVSAALHHIGMLEQEIDLRKTVEDAFVSQAGAYYDPRKRKFFVVMVMENDLIMSTIAAHELAHALQDQRFDLQKYYGASESGASSLSEDEAHARQFVVEGEATLLMTLYAPYKMTGQDPLAGGARQMLVNQLRQMASVDTETLVGSTKAQADMFVNMGEDMQRSVDAMDSIPNYILIPLLSAYMRGTLPVLEAYLAGGWEGVDELYKDPPQSTEQVLHPAEKLVGTRDYPVALTLPKGVAPKGYELLHEDVLGELIWQVYFDNWKVDAGPAAAAGWDGDRVAVYGKDGKEIGFIATIWDSPEDATEFENAYLASLEKRFPGQARAQARSFTSVPRGDDTYVFVQRKGANVYIVDGAGDDGPRLLSKLARTRGKKHPKDK